MGGIIIGDKKSYPGRGETKAMLAGRKKNVRYLFSKNITLSVFASGEKLIAPEMQIVHAVKYLRLRGTK